MAEFSPLSLDGPPLLPPTEHADRPLFVVMAILVTLACVAAIGARATWSATAAWTAELSSAITVQVRPTGALSGQAAALEAADIARSLPGVADAQALSREDALQLIEPWFGPGGLPESIPLPGLVDVRLSLATPATAADLEAALRARGLDATVDDHARWAQPLARTVGAARGLALATLVLLVSAAAVVISYAVRANLAARKDIVEILHMAGAQDSFIAGEFMGRFLRLAGWAGGVGAAAAGVIAIGVVMMTRTAPGAEMFFPGFSLEPLDGLILLIAPILAAVVGGATARRTVLQALRLKPWTG